MQERQLIRSRLRNHCPSPLDAPPAAERIAASITSVSESNLAPSAEVPEAKSAAAARWRAASSPAGSSRAARSAAKATAVSATTAAPSAAGAAPEVAEALPDIRRAKLAEVFPSEARDDAAPTLLRDETPPLLPRAAQGARRRWDGTTKPAADDARAESPPSEGRSPAGPGELPPPLRAEASPEAAEAARVARPSCGHWKPDPALLGPAEAAGDGLRRPVLLAFALVSASLNRAAFRVSKLDTEAKLDAPEIPEERRWWPVQRAPPSPGRPAPFRARALPGVAGPPWSDQSGAASASAPASELSLDGREPMRIERALGLLTSSGVSLGRRSAAEAPLARLADACAASHAVPGAAEEARRAGISAGRGSAAAAGAGLGAAAANAVVPTGSEVRCPGMRRPSTGETAPSPRCCGGIELRRPDATRPLGAAAPAAGAPSVARRPYPRSVGSCATDCQGFLLSCERSPPTTAPGATSGCAAGVVLTAGDGGRDGNSSRVAGASLPPPGLPTCCCTAASSSSRPQDDEMSMRLLAKPSRSVGWSPFSASAVMSDAMLMRRPPPVPLAALTSLRTLAFFKRSASAASEDLLRTSPHDAIAPPVACAAAAASFMSRWEPAAAGLEGVPTGDPGVGKASAAPGEGAAGLLGARRLLRRLVRTDPTAAGDGGAAGSSVADPLLLLAPDLPGPSGPAGAAALGPVTGAEATRNIGDPAPPAVGECTSPSLQLTPLPTDAPRARPLLREEAKGCGVEGPPAPAAAVGETGDASAAVSGDESET